MHERGTRIYLQVPHEDFSLDMFLPLRRVCSTPAFKKQMQIPVFSAAAPCDWSESFMQDCACTCKAVGCLCLNFLVI